MVLTSIIKFLTTTLLDIDAITKLHTLKIAFPGQEISTWVAGLPFLDGYDHYNVELGILC
jgi:hypothetical protein